MAVLVSFHGNEESVMALKVALSCCELAGVSLEVLVASRRDFTDPKTESDALEVLWNELENVSVSFKVSNAPVGVSVAESVLDYAKENDIKLIVLGLRQGGSRVTDLGINASRIMLDAPCPVLTTTEYGLPEFL
ncbi:universal stress protein [Gleimia sp. 6138-11-ORH1]|uniref:universal stress protein n=1 Tax=Gleimia sp. 6138-11-ORH1 TaxID=2973937 RepID=UPI00216A0C3F|nr:universal stress protein [Gleimia sp. 6138-11-ORH1]MCS4484443.1 universal stress protein [Gleimia sp. 6138-11-ORH1]